jgi:excisionase family DNA binding protein
MPPDPWPERKRAIVAKYLAQSERGAGDARPTVTRPARIRPPDGLRTRAEAAAKLGCSVRTLDEHVASGALRYVAIGHGKKRVRRMFSDSDVDEFIAAQTRKDVPCPSTATRAHRTGTTTSGGEVVAFTARPNARPGGKPKK